MNRRQIIKSLAVFLYMLVISAAGSAIAGPAQDPGNYVNIEFYGTGTACSAKQYTIPNGKALVIESITGILLKLGSAQPYGAVYFITNSDCAGQDFTASATSEKASQVNLNLSPGSSFPAGTSFYTYNYNSTSIAFIHGYLVPASAVPSSAEAVAQGLRGSKSPPIDRGSPSP